MADESSKSNQGTVRSGSGDTKIQQSYGKDSSDFVGSAADERGKKLAGSPTDLSHSLTGGVSAVQGSKK